MAAPGGAQARPMTSPLTWDRVSLWCGIAGLIATAIIFLIAMVLRGIAEGRGRSSALLTGADIAVMALFLPLAFLSIVGVISGIIGRKQAVTLEQRVRGARGMWGACGVCGMGTRLVWGARRLLCISVAQENGVWGLRSLLSVLVPRVCG